jgi:hypothetical protein
MFLDGILIAVALILFYGIIAIHDIPYQVAVHHHVEPFGEAECLPRFPLGTSLAFCEWRVA